MKAKLISETISIVNPNMNSIQEDKEDIWKDVRYGGKPYKNNMAYDPRDYRITYNITSDQLNDLLDKIKNKILNSKNNFNLSNSIKDMITYYLNKNCII